MPTQADIALQAAGIAPTEAPQIRSQADAALAAMQPTQGVAPSPLGSFGDNLAAGTGQFATNLYRGGRQLWNDLAAGLEKAVPDSVRNAINSVGGSAIPAQEQGRQEIAEARRLDAPLSQSGAGMLGNVAGSVMMAPLIPALGGGVFGAAAAGGALGAVEPATSWGERAGNIGMGAGMAGATQGTLGALARALSPKVTPGVGTLMDAGVTPTPGQIMGGGMKRAEEALTSVPVLGDAIKSAQGRGIEQLNTAVANRALAPIGESVPKGTTGRDLVGHVEGQLSDKYNALLPKLTTQMDPQFAQDVGKLSQMVSSGNLPKTQVDQFSSILQTKVLDKFMGQNAITGETMKDIESNLGSLSRNYGRSTDPDQRALGDAIQELQSNLRGLVQRSNPQYANELQAINSGYANFKRLQAASGGIGADAGTFTPAQLASAVRRMDPSKDKAAYARGDALLQDLSDPAKELLSPKLPDSGTAYRGLAGALAASGGAAAMGHPTVAAGTALGALLGPALYANPTQKALAALLTKRPGWAGPTAAELEYLAPMLSAGSAALPNATK